MSDIKELFQIAKSTNNIELLKYIAEKHPNEYKQLEQSSVTKKKRGRPKKEEIIVDNKKPSRILDISQFKINKEKSASGRKLSRGEPVKWRGNLWVDDGVTEKGGIENITPKVKPVPRTRAKYEKVSIECKECKEHVVIDQIHVRENFVCDSCIESKRKRVSRSS